MTFGDILNAVCQDGISATRRSDAKQWVIARHAWLWGAQPWTFRNATADIVFTENQQQAAGPADVGAVLAVYTAQGDPLVGIRDIRKFFDRYNTLGYSSSGTPEAYTVVGGQVLVGPKGDGSTGLIVYQKTKPTLTNDGDSTGLPDGFDLALVHAARAEGFKLTNAFQLAEFEDAEFNAAIGALENDWLEDVLETGGQVGAYRPGRQTSAYR
jgi:hypothetical protein